MAGYFTKLNGRVYDGFHVSDIDLENGKFVTIDDNGKIVLAEAAEGETLGSFRCEEKTTLWGLPALRVDVLGCSEGMYMVEADFNPAEHGEYDETQHVTKAGELVKMRMPVVGDQIIVSVSDELYAAAEKYSKLTVEDGELVIAE